MWPSSKLKLMTHVFHTLTYSSISNKNSRWPKFASIISPIVRIPTVGYRGPFRSRNATPKYIFGFTKKPGEFSEMVILCERNIFNNRYAPSQTFTKVSTVLCVEQRHVSEVHATSDRVPCRKDGPKRPAVSTASKAVAVVAVISP